ncbi:MAG TPA: undecaprenyl-diphosphate phosphatase [Candidatus Nitrosocosmicus sp.]|nr:undecaprenyl-diphosphate phosphatase [Candidatus Nitrosocosmicus sp.]
MNIFHAIILGIVEGMTEFLPISSTFHLIFTSKLLGLEQTEYLKFFEVFIQAGAILAVVVVYFQYILKNKQNIKSVLISFIPTAVIGFLLHKIIKNLFFNSDQLMIGAFFVVGILFLVIEYLIQKKKLMLHKSIMEITLMTAILIGLGQALAVLPGVSRAGAVMITMMILGYKREEAALYSFLLAVPTILAASSFDLLKFDFSLLNHGASIVYLATGFITAFLSALVVIKWFIRFLQKNSLVPFGIYRLVSSAFFFLIK